MACFLVEGGRRLEGTWRVDSAKNAVLPLMAAAVLTPDPVTLTEVPDIADVRSMADILGVLGAEVTREGNGLRIASQSLHSWEMPDRLSKQIRSSIIL